MDAVLLKMAREEPAIRDLLLSFTQANRESVERAAKADPHKHRLTRVMENNDYRYWRAGTDGRGREVRFCWSTHRNVAGYFLSWREVIGKNGGKRDQWSARKARSACKELAAQRQNAWIDKCAKEPA